MSHSLSIETWQSQLYMVRNHVGEEVRCVTSQPEDGLPQQKPPLLVEPGSTPLDLLC